MMLVCSLKGQIFDTEYLTLRCISVILLKFRHPGRKKRQIICKKKKSDCPQISQQQHSETEDSEALSTRF